MVFDPHYNVVQANPATFRMLSLFFEDLSVLPQPINILELLFDPKLGRTFLHRPNDEGLARLRERLLAYPDVPKSWHLPDVSKQMSPALEVRLKRGDVELAFLTTLTTFNAPQSVTVQELVIESYYPLDDATAELCAQLADG